MATQMSDRAQTTVRMEKQLYQDLQQAARERGVSTNTLMAIALRGFLDRLIPIDEVKLTR